MSEPTPIDLPVGLRWVKLVCRLGRLVTDSAADVDAHPDLLPVGGTLTLTAFPSRVRVQEDDGRWRSVEVAGRTYTIRADGELVDNEGRVGVYIPDPASLLVEPQGYAITASVKPSVGSEWRVTVAGSAVLPDVVDLVAVSSVGSVSPNVTGSFDARLYALEQGVGVDVSQAVEDYLTANPPAGTGGSGVTTDDTPAKPAEGQSASYLVTSAVVWPADLVWSDDPDGGTAPTITGTALVSLFTLDGTTRAIMGATFPALPPPPDTTAPVAGTLAVVPSSTSALGTVTGASDAVALAAAPYSFRRGSGAWSAWQASASYTWTGLTASTAYTFQHRVRDAAGNITEGTAVTDTTDAPAVDSTPPTVGTMTVSSISDTGFRATIAGAADETALDAAPYAFTIDGGTTWTAYQASATYTASGLTAETAYSVNWRVRDAAGNVSTGSAQTVTTTAAGAPIGTLADEIMALAPSGYWKLNETTGTQAVDHSGNARHGTYSGDIGLDYSGSGYAYIAATGVVTVPDSDAWSIAGSSGLTIFALEKRSALGSVSAPIAAKTQAGQFEWALWLPNTGNSIYFQVWNADASASLTSDKATGTVPLATWNAIAASMPAPTLGAAASIYLNDGSSPLEATHTQASVTLSNGPAPLVFGKRLDNTHTFDGQLAHVAIFAGPLSSGQVARLMDAARAEGFIS